MPERIRPRRYIYLKSHISKAVVYKGQGYARRKADCHILGAKAKEDQRKTLTHLVDGLGKDFLEKLPYMKAGQSGGDDVSCEGNGITKIENVSRV